MIQNETLQRVLEKLEAYLDRAEAGDAKWNKHKKYNQFGIFDECETKDLRKLLDRMDTARA
jgi:hypothetical protein